MVSLHGSKPTHPLLGLGLVSLLVGVFYVGATLPASEPPHQAEEVGARLPPSEPPHQAENWPQTGESVALEDLEKLDSLDDLDDEALLRILGDDPERFYGGPCEAWVAEAPSE